MLGFGVLVHIAHILEVFWRPFGPFLEHIVELKGTRGLFDTVKGNCTCGVVTLSLCLRILPEFWGYFGRKMAVFWPKTAQIGRAPPNLAPTPRVANGEFWAQKLDLALAWLK